MNTRVRAAAFVAMCACVAGVTLGTRSARADGLPTPVPANTVHAVGQVLAIAAPYVVFVTGDALRLSATTAVPHDVTLGSTVLVSVDRTTHEITRIERDAHAADEIDIAAIPRDFIVVAAKSARAVAPSNAVVPNGGPQATLASAGAPRANATVTLAVTVPANTPPSDDVYVSSDRSNFSPAEVRMERVDSRRFVVTVPLDANGTLRYQYTRGTYGTVERDRSGGIVAPHVADGASSRLDDTVIRWADTN